MMLSDVAIRNAILSGDLLIYPFEDALVKPASIDLRLGTEFLAFARDGSSFGAPTKVTVIDPKADIAPYMERSSASATRPFVLRPGMFALASTLETVSLGTSLVGRLEGKSSLGRLGLMVHITAGYIDPGFQGEITLELWNAAPAPILLYPEMPIAQLSFMQLCSLPAAAYGTTNARSKYQGQRGPTPSRYHLNFADAA